MAFVRVAYLVELFYNFLGTLEFRHTCYSCNVLVLRLGLSALLLDGQHVHRRLIHGGWLRVAVLEQ